MSYQSQHTFVAGALVAGAALASCSHCEVLRVTEGERVHFLSPVAKEIDEPGDDGAPEAWYDGPILPRRRLPLVLVAPPCVSPPPFRRAPW